MILPLKLVTNGGIPEFVELKCAGFYPDPLNRYLLTWSFTSVLVKSSLQSGFTHLLMSCMLGTRLMNAISQC